jgi:hypothetical protein
VGVPVESAETLTERRHPPDGASALYVISGSPVTSHATL